MSRITYFDIDSQDDMLRAGRWEGRVKSVLNGRPARKHFALLLDALLAMPDHRIITDALCDRSGDVCALGAMALHGLTGDERAAMRQVLLGFDGLDKDEDDPDYGYGADGDEIARWAAKHFNMTYTLAWLIQEANDETMAWMTPEDRWAAMVQWARERS